MVRPEKRAAGLYHRLEFALFHVKPSTDLDAFEPLLVHRGNDQLARDFGDRQKEFPQVIHIQLGRWIVQHEGRGSSAQSAVALKLGEDESGRQHLLLATRHPVSSSYTLNDKTDVGAMRPDMGGLQPQVPGYG